MKKGFTLIELLAVIVILAVILVIAIPQVLKVVDNSRISAYIKNEEMVLKALDLYVSRNTGVLPGEIGSTTEVSINYLVENGMLTEIKNPYNKNEDCTGYVTIIKLSDTEYDYTPHLRCGLDIHDSTDDGLVLHYKFNDFQEPTENHVQNGDVYTTLYWSRGVNSSVGDIIIMNHLEGECVVGNRCIEFDVQTRTSWSYTRHTLFHYLPQGWFDVSRNYTLSFFARRKSGTNNLSVHISDGTSANIVMYAKSAVLTSEWQRFEYTFKPVGSGNLPLVFFSVPQGNVYQLDGLQLEKKPYATPFVDGTRQGMVKDLSFNNNHAELQLETTPRWLEKSKVGKGSYEFNGENTSIIVGNHESLNLTQENGFTFHAWINPSEGYGNVYPRIIDKSHFLNIEASSGRPYFRVSGDNNNSMAMSQDQLAIDEWTHLVGTYNSFDNRARLYVNGVLAATSGTLIEGLKDTNDISLKIGDNGAGARSFNGLIDDVRIYNRALSDKEIKLLYESTK